MVIPMDLVEWYETLSNLQLIVFWVLTIALGVWAIGAVIGQGKMED